MVFAENYVRGGDMSDRIEAHTDLLISLCTGSCAGHGGIGQQRCNCPEGTLATHRDSGGLRQ